MLLQRFEVGAHHVPSVGRVPRHSDRGVRVNEGDAESAIHGKSRECKMRSDIK
jgi:hypothetical protein